MWSNSSGERGFSFSQLLTQNLMIEEQYQSTAVKSNSSIARPATPRQDYPAMQEADVLPLHMPAANLELRTDENDLMMMSYQHLPPEENANVRREEVRDDVQPQTSMFDMSQRSEDYDHRFASQIHLSQSGLESSQFSIPPSPKRVRMSTEEFFHSQMNTDENNEAFSYTQLEINATLFSNSPKYQAMESFTQLETADMLDTTLQEEKKKEEEEMDEEEEGTTTTTIKLSPDTEEVYHQKPAVWMERGDISIQNADMKTEATQKPRSEQVKEKEMVINDESLSLQIPQTEKESGQDDSGSSERQLESKQNIEQVIVSQEVPAKSLEVKQESKSETIMSPIQRVHQKEQVLSKPIVQSVTPNEIEENLPLDPADKSEKPKPVSKLSSARALEKFVTRRGSKTKSHTTEYVFAAPDHVIEDKGKWGEESIPMRSRQKKKTSAVKTSERVSALDTLKEGGKEEGKQGEHHALIAAPESDLQLISFKKPSFSKNEVSTPDIVQLLEYAPRATSNHGLTLAQLEDSNIKSESRPAFTCVPLLESAKIPYLDSVEDKEIKRAKPLKSYAIYYGELLTLLHYKGRHLSEADILSLYNESELVFISSMNNYIAGFHGDGSVRGYAMFILHRLESATLSVPVIKIPKSTSQITQSLIDSNPFSPQPETAPSSMQTDDVVGRHTVKSWNIEITADSTAQAQAWGPYAYAVLLGGTQDLSLRLDVSAYLEFMADQIRLSQSSRSAFTEAFRVCSGEAIVSTCESLSQLLELYRKRHSTTSKQSKGISTLTLDIEIVGVTCAIYGQRLAHRTCETHLVKSNLRKKGNIKGSGESLMADVNQKAKNPSYENEPSIKTQPFFYEMDGQIANQISVNQAASYYEVFRDNGEEPSACNSHVDVVRVRAFKPKSEISSNASNAFSSRELMLVLPPYVLHPLQCVWLAKKLQSFVLQTITLIPEPCLPKNLRSTKHILSSPKDLGFDRCTDVKVGDVCFLSLNTPSMVAPKEQTKGMEKVDEQKNVSTNDAKELIKKGLGATFQRLFLGKEKVGVEHLNVEQIDELNVYERAKRENRSLVGLYLLICGVEAKKSHPNQREVTGIWLSSQPWESVTLGSGREAVSLVDDTYLSGVNTSSAIPIEVLMRTHLAVDRALEDKSRQILMQTLIFEHLQKVKCPKTTRCIQILALLIVVLPMSNTNASAEKDTHLFPTIVEIIKSALNSFAFDFLQVNNTDTLALRREMGKRIAGIIGKIDRLFRRMVYDAKYPVQHEQDFLHPHQLLYLQSRSAIQLITLFENMIVDLLKFNDTVRDSYVH